MLALTAGNARAEIVPEMGAGVATLDVGDKAVLRRWSGNPADGPFALGMNLLVPFSNRISGGFTYAGRSYRIAPNHPGESFVIHGDGFQKPWAISAHDENSATLQLQNGQIGPWHYQAEVSYHLTPEHFLSTLSLASKAEQTLPFGLGFHPWFPRNTQTKLAFSATGQWEVDDRYLPTGTTPSPIPSAIDFSSSRQLSEHWINTAYSGWDGVAHIAQGDAAQSLTLIAEGLKMALVYSPSGDADFFCFEPISHPTDAHNLPGMPGLAILEPGQSLSVSMIIAWTTPPGGLSVQSLRGVK